MGFLCPLHCCLSVVAVVACKSQPISSEVLSRFCESLAYKVSPVVFFPQFPSLLDFGYAILHHNDLPTNGNTEKGIYGRAIVICILM